MKEIDNLWIWPPGGSGNFILKHYYGGKTLPNNEFVANSIKWFPKYLNVSHAEYFLQAKSEYILPNYLYDRAKKEILAQNETDYAWHWIPVHIKDFLSVKKLFFIHAQPEDMWFTSFLTQIKNVNTVLTLRNQLAIFQQILKFGDSFVFVFYYEQKNY